MIKSALLAAALLCATPVVASEPAARAETSIPDMSRFLEWRPDGNQALFIRAESGRWYRATLEAPCPRLQNRSATGFEASPSDRFDRFSAIQADGWRCRVASVARSEGPPPRPRR
jgi:hypothetical protein